MSPDGKTAIATVTSNVYIMSVPMVGGTTPTISVANPATATVPARRISHVGGDFIGWSADGSSLYYSLGHSFFTTRSVVANAAGDDSTRAAPTEPTRVDVKLTVPRDRPAGVVALVGARIITMKDDEVIPNGTIVVRDNRIAGGRPAVDR